MTAQNADKKKLFRGAAIVLLIVFLLSLGFLGVEIWERNQGKYPALNASNAEVEYQGQKYEKRSNIETFLVMGLDKSEDGTAAESYNNDKQADFLVLFVFDHDKKSCTTIQINRDTMVPVNVLGVAGNPIDTVTKQIALAHTYGNGKDVSCHNVADSVSSLLYGAKVDHYISVTMDAVPLVNDLVGGVEVEVLDDFSGIDPQLVKGQTVTLKGQQALTYVRTRYGLEDSSNSTRMVRQKQYLQALQKKAEQCDQNDPQFMVNAAAQLSEYMVSDRSVNQLQELAKHYFAYTSGGTLDIPGESVKGETYMEFYPDADALQKMVIDLFYQPKD